MSFITSFFSNYKKEDTVLHSLAKLNCDEHPKPIPIYIHPTAEDGKEKIHQTVLGLLGEGGTKRVYALEEGKALFMPRFESVSDIKQYSSFWIEALNEEVKGCKRIRELGCMASNLEEVDLYMTSDSTLKLPAYESETFDHMAGRGVYIIETKNSETSTWHHSLFYENVDRFDEKNWEGLLNPFLKDIAKLLVNHVCLYSDNTTLAIIKKPQIGPISDYEVHYFGFDFSGCNCFCNASEQISDTARDTISKALSSLLFSEFGDEANQEKVNQLRQKLQAMCVNQVFLNIGS